MIAQTTIDEVMARLDIAEVIGSRVDLKKRGSSYTGLCPFHNEKTPSFHVSPARGIFKCFGCGKSGSAVGFLMEHEQMGYPEAIRHLAEMYKVPVQMVEQTPEEVLARDHREKLYVLMQWAAGHFQRELSTCGQAMEYLSNRGIWADTLSLFGIGWAPDKWDGLLAAAKEKGYTKQELLGVGLARQKEDKVYDTFRGRVIFPIQNEMGKVVGFGGRVLPSIAVLLDKGKGGKGEIPKYINSPETDIYDKSAVLYGLHQARAAIGKAGYAWLVEGYTDVLAMHQGGCRNTVATCGTALTEAHCKLLRKHTHHVVVLRDGDGAGREAAERDLLLLLRHEMKVEVAMLPPGEDPDTFARTEEKEEVPA